MDYIGLAISVIQLILALSLGVILLGTSSGRREDPLVRREGFLIVAVGMMGAILDALRWSNVLTANATIWPVRILTWAFLILYVRFFYRIRRARRFAG